MSEQLTIVVLPASSDGSAYHRMYQPVMKLKENSRHIVGIPAPGHQVPAPTAKDMEEGEVDVLAAQRPVGKLGQKTWEGLGGSVARVYEIDDDLINPDPSGLPHLCDPKLIESGKRLMAVSEMITVSTPYLAELYAPLNRNIRVLPNYIHEQVVEEIHRPHRDRVTFGYQGGDSHLADICSVQDPLMAFLHTNPDVDFHWIGKDYSPLVHRECLWSPWSEDIWTYYRKVDFDVALAPLADIPFNLGKSYLKALDAAALGIPVIAQDMEPYREFVRDGETGYLVRTPDEWLARMTELAHDAAAREEMGAKARELARQYLIQDHWQEWEHAYEDAARGGH
jgi:glycosyltransferase involved in cell wall biosynthesis